MVRKVSRLCVRAELLAKADSETRSSWADVRQRSLMLFSRQLHQILHQYLTIRMCETKHQFIQSAESTAMISQILDQPTDYFDRVRRYSTGVILSIIYGRRGPTWKGPVEDIYSGQSDCAEVAPAARWSEG